MISNFSITGACHRTLPGQATSTGSWVTGHKVLQEGPFIGLPAEWKVPLQSLHDGGRVGQGKALTQQLRMGSKYLKSNDKNIKINVNIPYTKGSLFSTCFSFLMIFMFYWIQSNLKSFHPTPPYQFDKVVLTSWEPSSMYSMSSSISSTVTTISWKF